MTLVCWNCGGSLEDVPRPISRHANCRHCREVLHCCRLCRFFAPGEPPNECRHDRAEPPVEKESANFCDYFVPRAGAFDQTEGEQKSAAKQKFESLFGAGDEQAGDDNEAGDQTDADADRRPSDKDDLRSRLDDLFDD